MNNFINMHKKIPKYKSCHQYSTNANRILKIIIISVNTPTHHTFPPGTLSTTLSNSISRYPLHNIKTYNQNRKTIQIKSTNFQSWLPPQNKVGKIAPSIFTFTA